MTRAYNFAPGPAALPEPVLRQAQADMLEYQDAGASIVELSHRGPEFVAVASAAEADLRKLVGIPDDYAVLFLGGGATTQQALLPLNLASEGQTVDYVVTGHWGKTALKQVDSRLKLNVAASSESDHFHSIPARETWKLTPGAAYVHVTANETIHGTEFRHTPDVGDAPLVADFSSSIASEPLDVSRYGVIYAGAQKNLGPVGVAVVIIRRDLLERAGLPRAEIFNYGVHNKHESMLNTPPSWNWYLAGLTFKWMLAEGGVAEFARRSQVKAKMLYAAIDGSGGFYRNEVDPAVRSRMNVPFFLPDETLTSKFVSESKVAGLISLKGHRVLGGIRASIYNAMPVEGVRALVDFMHDFQKRNG
ncbi:MAG: phosphoserine transaminase [Xanthomonadaceae bacterium]|jgi:phosphoserine aminotransferase|nr:phosphoserine transaminase [Xanthomonadaceae bacterium]